jgi:hypothetical protein
VKGQCKITMLDYIKETLHMFKKVAPTESGNKMSVGPKNLFFTEKKCDKLAPNKKETFLLLVAKILFAAKRARPATATAISFLTTRVRAPIKTIGRNASIS